MEDTPSVYGSLPSAVYLTEYFPVPGNQGTQNSCTAWAVAYALKSGQENMKRGWSRNSSAHQFSPSFVYNLVNNGKNEGAFLSDVFDIVSEYGVCSLNYFPYDQNDYKTKPTANQIGAARLYQSAYWINIKGIPVIKNHIAGGDGVVIGIEVYPDFYDISASNQIYDKISGTAEGGHAICLIGYDDSKGAFKFINSWGSDWGLDGYGWISYDLVNDIRVNHYGTVIGYVMHPETDDYFVGDVNEDGIIDASDAMLVLQYAAQTLTPTPRQNALSDVDGNAVVDSTGANYILKYAAQTISKLPLYD